ncbi:MAG: hypothetical protein ABJC98_18205 [Bacteroidota bacterium]
MDEMKGSHIIKSLRGKWILYALLSDALISTGTSFLMAVLTNKLFAWSVWWGILYGCIVFVFLFFVHRPWLVKEESIAQLLDQNYPRLEESAGLLLLSVSSLNMLESLQYKKTNNALQAINAPLSIGKKLMAPAFILAIMLGTGIALYKIPLHNNPVQKKQTIAPVAKVETILPQITAVSIGINPPAYTAKPVKLQHAFNLVAEEGSLVDWQLKTSMPVREVKFIFNDTVQIALQPTDTAHNQWRTAKKIDSTGFYQVSIDGKASELYKIETVTDKAPVINVLSPRQYTTIDFGQSQQVKINTTISDDYGIKDAFIATTIASGSGEAVKFKEQKIALTGFVAGRSQYQLQQLLLLPGLGMQPGDELYFYVQATDNHQQQTRSDIYIVHLPDTAQLMSLEGLGNSLTLKPEYFRSQRQIIIETEQLLKDRDTISEETFKNKSNNLGIDQKLLRLRYGKFLGDEVSGETTGADGLGDIADFSNAEKVMDAFTDKHDNSEDATYLDPETKKQLRATLTEMWDAELHLRTFTPKDALPFEYKALRLLKELQQKSRAYVAKTNFKTTPLDLNKRLTGDQSKINQLQLQKDISRETDPQQPVRIALAILEKIKIGSDNNNAAAILQQANLRLHEKAIRQPALYLTAVEALTRIITALNMQENVQAADMLIVQHGLQQLLTVPDRLPSAAASNSKQTLSKQYFDNLQNRQP